MPGSTHRHPRGQAMGRLARGPRSSPPRLRPRQGQDPLASLLWSRSRWAASLWRTRSVPHPAAERCSLGAGKGGQTGPGGSDFRANHSLPEVEALGRREEQEGRSQVRDTCPELGPRGPLPGTSSCLPALPSVMATHPVLVSVLLSVRPSVWWQAGGNTSPGRAL